MFTSTNQQRHSVLHFHHHCSHAPGNGWGQPHVLLSSLCCSHWS
jgi:hypothetical protein